MDHRGHAEYSQAIDKLQNILTDYPQSYLADDAQYLIGYIELIDLDKPADALRSMHTLRANYPDTTYFDSSLYSEAIAYLDIGNSPEAQEILEQLIHRHTGLNALGFQLPKDNLHSRSWFERASNMLATMDG